MRSQEPFVFKFTVQGKAASAHFSLGLEVYWELLAQSAKNRQIFANDW